MVRERAIRLAVGLWIALSGAGFEHRYVQAVALTIETLSAEARYRSLGTHPSFR